MLSNFTCTKQPNSCHMKMIGDEMQISDSSKIAWQPEEGGKTTKFFHSQMSKTPSHPMLYCTVQKNVEKGTFLQHNSNQKVFGFAQSMLQPMLLSCQKQKEAQNEKSTSLKMITCLNQDLSFFVKKIEKNAYFSCFFSIKPLLDEKSHNFGL